jgi:hypothetical protein
MMILTFRHRAWLSARMRHEHHHMYQIEGEMMPTTCLRDHSLEGTIPRFLCRACHPELNVSAATRAERDAEDREARPRAVAEEAHQPGSFQSAAIAA